MTYCTLLFVNCKDVQLIRETLFSEHSLGNFSTATLTHKSESLLEIFIRQQWSFIHLAFLHVLDALVDNQHKENRPNRAQQDHQTVGIHFANEQVNDYHVQLAN